MAIEARDLQRSTEARFRQTNNAMRVAERQAHRLLTAAYGGTLERLYPLPETPGPNAPLMPHASAALRSPELNALLDAEFDLDNVDDDDPLVAAAAAAAAQADAARAGMFRGSFSSRSRDLDLLYRDNDIDAAEGFIVVEAKGGSARLGDKEIAPGTPRAWQGTVAYLDKTIEEMVARGDAPWAAQLQHALRGGSVRYLAVMVPYRNATPDARDPNRKRTLLSATLRIQRFL